MSFSYAFDTGKELAAMHRSNHDRLAGASGGLADGVDAGVGTGGMLLLLSVVASDGAGACTCEAALANLTQDVYGLFGAMEVRAVDRIDELSDALEDK